MKKCLALVLSVLMAASLAACGSSSSSETEAATEAAAETEAAEEGETEAAEAEATGEGIAAEDLKIGIIFVGDENEGYSASHLYGIQEAAENLGISEDQIICKFNIPEDENCYDAAVDLADQGCQIVFATSFGHESYAMQAAAEFPDVEFCHATGYQAASSGLDNFHNYFDNIYEARYVTGIVAGMKLNEMLEDGSITDAKIGYVGAYPYAEVVSGYTAFYLGVKSVCDSATMEVKYTNSWASLDLEKECADSLMSDGCVLISQHADTTGAPTACEAAGVPCVGYNIDMIATAPTTALTSSTSHFASYYEYALQCVMNGEAIDTDWAKGFADGAVAITDLNTDVVAEGTQEAVDAAIEAIKSGELHVFDTSTFTIGGQSMEDIIAAGGELKSNADAVYDGYYHESELASAPSFADVIDGITEN